MDLLFYSRSKSAGWYMTISKGDDMLIHGDALGKYIEEIKAIKEIILTNIVLIGQTPNVVEQTFEKKENRRVTVFLERLLDVNVDECSIDADGNPFAIIKGSNPKKKPIMLVAHMDTVHSGDSESNYTISNNHIIGSGLLDNSLGVGILMSIPSVLSSLNISFESDIVIVGLPESLRESNLKSIRDVLENWSRPPKAGICVEGGELGRLSYFSKSMIRAEIEGTMPRVVGGKDKGGFNAIIVMNEVINEILKIRLPQRPKTDIIFGRLNSGFKHGEAPQYASLGFEIHSDRYSMVEELFLKIEEICGNVSHINNAKIRVKKVSNIRASHLSYHHPLVVSAVQVLDALNIKPSFESSESELSVFLGHNIPAITLGISQGKNYHENDEQVLIDSIFTGIAQLIGVISARPRRVE